MNFFDEADEFFVSEEGFVSLTEDVEYEAERYFEELFENNILEVAHWTDIIGLIEEEDNFITQFVFEMYPDEDILDFFEEHGDIFSIANGYVSLISERDLVNEESDAVEYLSRVVKDNNGYYSVHELHEFAVQDEEGSDIMDLINDFYPEDFHVFLENNDVFFMDYEGLVYLKELVDDDAVEYFKEIFIAKMYHPVHYKSLYGHIGQSPPHVMKYINEDFGRSGFLQFFEMHKDTFNVRRQGFISYIGNDAAEYFARVLQNYYYDMPHYSTFRGHIGQAPSYIVNFINTKYPNEQFCDFLLESKSFFVVDEDGYVKHSADYEDLQIH